MEKEKEKKNNRGYLFKNSYKEEAKQPDYKGSIKVKDVEFELAAWIEEGRKGKYLSISAKELSIEPKPEDAAPAAPDPVATAADDDLPF